MADLKGCSSVLFFEARKKQDCYLWVAKSPSGPCAKFHVANGASSLWLGYWSELDLGSCVPCGASGHAAPACSCPVPALRESVLIHPSPARNAVREPAPLFVRSAHDGGAETQRQPPEGLAAGAQLRQGEADDTTLLLRLVVPLQRADQLLHGGSSADAQGFTQEPSHAWLLAAAEGNICICLDRAFTADVCLQGFEAEPHLRLVREMLRQLFATPVRHPKSKPFADHVMSFHVADGRIWIRNYQARR